jgi:hypothetical protein
LQFRRNLFQYLREQSGLCGHAGKDSSQDQQESNRTMEFAWQVISPEGLTASRGLELLRNDVYLSH